MTYDMDTLNLRDAFGPMPDDIREALMSTARSVKEEEPVKRITIRTVLIAAAIILVTMAVAIAAGQFFGWNDFFSIFYGNTRVPQAAQEIMAASKEETFTVGPATFRIQERYADKHTALASVQVTMTDGSLALMTMSGQQEDPLEANGENGRNYAKLLGVDPSLSWIEAAKELNCPLYIMRGILDLDSEYWGGEEAEDVLYDASGNFVYYSMQMLDGSKVGDTLPLRFYLRVAEVDLGTGEEQDEALTERPELMIDVSPAMETITYELPENYTAYGLKLDAVWGELTPAGLYLFTDFTAGENADIDEFRCPVWTDADGKEYSFGLNMSYDVDVESWPKVHMMGLISVDSIPDTLIMTMPGDENAQPLVLKK